MARKALPASRVRGHFPLPLTPKAWLRHNAGRAGVGGATSYAVRTNRQLPRGARTRPFPWDEVMGLGLGLLRLESRAFWSLTPREFAAAARAILPPQAAGPRR